jgi:hypothetical protein
MLSSVAGTGTAHIGNNVGSGSAAGDISLAATRSASCNRSRPWSPTTSPAATSPSRFPTATGSRSPRRSVTMLPVVVASEPVNSISP